MNTFYTITNQNTTHTNDRSERFPALAKAHEAAKSRLQRGLTKGVIILQAIELVKFSELPVVVEKLNMELGQIPE